MTESTVQAFPMSPRNSSAAICHMLRKVSAHRLMVTAASLGALLSEVKEELAASGYELSIEELPAFTDIYPHFGFETADMSFKSLALPSADAFVNNVPLILHSSGSTVLPIFIVFSGTSLNAVLRAFRSRLPGATGFWHRSRTALLQTNSGTTSGTL
jgi:hypothetical protein